MSYVFFVFCLDLYIWSRKTSFTGIIKGQRGDCAEAIGGQKCLGTRPPAYGRYKISCFVSTCCRFLHNRCCQPRQAKVQLSI